MDDLFSPDPMEYFASVAGPNIADVAGPGGDVLDVYADGTPIAMGQNITANGVGGGMHRYPWQRGDVQAALLAVAGAVMIHMHARS